eukprot:11979375-Alexandrium_andersonii.AAC.1
MSASLVGSEMCIRDRKRRARAPDLTKCCRPAFRILPGSDPPVPHWAAAHGQEQVDTCLLYTSPSPRD